MFSTGLLGCIVRLDALLRQTPTDTVVVRLVCFTVCFYLHQPPVAVPNTATDVSARAGIVLTILRPNRCDMMYQGMMQRRTNKKHEKELFRLDFFSWVSSTLPSV